MMKFMIISCIYNCIMIALLYSYLFLLMCMTRFLNTNFFKYNFIIKFTIALHIYDYIMIVLLYFYLSLPMYDSLTQFLNIPSGHKVLHMAVQ